MSELLELITRSLCDCRPETIATLRDGARVRTVRRHEAIYRQGEPAPLTLVTAGYGAFRRTTADGQDLMIGVAGDFVPVSRLFRPWNAVQLVL